MHDQKKKHLAVLSRNRTLFIPLRILITLLHSKCCHVMLVCMNILILTLLSATRKCFSILACLHNLSSFLLHLLFFCATQLFAWAVSPKLLSSVLQLFVPYLQSCANPDEDYEHIWLRLLLDFLYIFSYYTYVLVCAIYNNIHKLTYLVYAFHGTTPKDWPFQCHLCRSLTAKHVCQH